MLYTTIDSGSDLQDLFKVWDRDNQFSPLGFDALYEYLEEYSEGTDLEVDVVGICCDFEEVTETDLLLRYVGEDDEFETHAEKLSWILERLRDNGKLVAIVSHYYNEQDSYLINP